MILSVILVFTLCLAATTVTADSSSDNFKGVMMLASDQKALEKLLPSQCPGSEWSKRTRCVRASGNFKKDLDDFFNDLGVNGCKKAPEEIMKHLSQFGVQTEDHPIYQRIKNRGDCGVCGRQLSCCGTREADETKTTLVKQNSELESIDPFFFQGLRGEGCSRSVLKAPVCVFDPLSPTEFDTLETLQPYSKPINRDNECGLSQFGYAEWEAIKSESVFPLFKDVYQRMMCRVFQTTKPRVNCVKDAESNKCVCCCHRYRPIPRSANQELALEYRYQCIPMGSSNPDDGACTKY